MGRVKETYLKQVHSLLQLYLLHYIPTYSLHPGITLYNIITHTFNRKHCYHTVFVSVQWIHQFLFLSLTLDSWLILLSDQVSADEMILQCWPH